MRAKHDELGHLVSAALQLMLIMIAATSVAEAASPLAKPGCQQKCGSVDIPYPFGIGNSSCYLDEWFEITCGRPNSTVSNTSSGGSKPFLKKLNVELLEVVLPTYGRQTNGYITVQNPVIVSSSNCTGRTTSNAVTTAVDLTGSSFYFSTDNKFGAAGCNSRAWMTDENGKERTSYGCNPSCRSSAVGECCNVAIPSSLQLFQVSITSSISDDDGSCRYAFMARDKWFNEHPSTSCFTDITDLDSVPAWMDFGLKDSDPLAASLQQAKTNKNSAFGCTGYSYSDNTNILFCFCKQGYEGNPYVQNGCQDIDECLDGPPEGCKGCKNTIGNYTCRSTTGIVIKVVCSIVGVLLLILAVWGGFKIMKSIQRKKFFKQNGGLLVTQNEGNAKKTTLYKMEEMKKATHNFSKKNRLGAGGQGTVFKGALSDGTQVAIKECKKVETKDKKPEKSSKDKSLEAPDHENHEMSAFITEIVLLSETIHKNIVKLWGCCLEAKNPLLVYEHLVNGDLSSHLQNQDANAGLFILSWDMRLKIATEIAGALSYLHFSARYPIFHRDIKTDNILLDHNFTAKIADFGISKSVTGNQSRVDNVPVQGSRGYMDPEYIESGQYTGKSDVYSFGVVLVELLTGRQPIFKYTAPGGEPITVILANHFKAMKVDQLLSTFLDARVKHQGQPKEIVAVANLARECLNSEGRLRPTMKDVAMELQRISAAHNNAYNADEIDQHDYEAVENPTMSPVGGHQTMPLRAQSSELSDSFRGK